ncbi:MAG TPA: sodium/solute symporter [Thermoguttaceae bacterium]|nr:sodium/solute symporter [Thermoguttaceae bacterium]
MQTAAVGLRTRLSGLVFPAGLLGTCVPAMGAEDAPIDRAIVQGNLTGLDWAVLVAYAAGMILIGVYYSRQNQSADDYLLGGRQMRPWLVGLSMFATFFSALTYLALPGEVVAHGPMILAEILGFPIVALVVCWLVIPRIMQFQVTSGYEILETRLGESVRLLAAVTFLLVRFLWMGLMIYATVDKILVPVTGIDPVWAPWVCIILGAITVVYASMGGLRAVVMSDAIQAIILFAGAVLAVILITVDLGGISAWWPSQWQTHWDPFRLWMKPGARMSLLEPVLWISTWWIATACADQMAIQRYLSTRDVKSARRMFGISVIANLCIVCLLGLLGFAILAFFQRHPEMMAATQSVTKNADQLFPRFMTVGLPTGITGVVIAALMAATMSSLSAGVNSVSSVIATDLVGYFRKTPSTEQSRLRAAKRISWIAGLIAVILSLIVAQIPGNLLELCNKVANVFTAPLFILFFMAIFVPWATKLGAWTGALASATVAIGISLFGWFGLGFLWIVIGSTLAGVIVGPTVSAMERLIVGAPKRRRED